MQILHKGRLQGPKASAKEAQELITNLCEEDMLYSSPFGSNDDWYWIYATVKAGKARACWLRSCPCGVKTVK